MFDLTGMTVEEIADAWVIESYNSNRDTPLPRWALAQFHAWLKADPAHHAALIDSQRTWNALASVPQQDLLEALQDGTHDQCAPYRDTNQHGQFR